ncbi:hypothetical protein NCAS_0I01710 [Naumovozyma castellii]|uniref:Uncharacterized protein n=1 Tax=Naumovozyma castellii TaxID=27288 RepID=G0VK05_NAUCA|nr:hypothetical protein NCAS_0I01710 [Naumovozyma castellii CBS 4309]CCC71839.1 hypothetical protein NCAS_0I01710 [Naumovozyma castellii CBS 4309]
MNKLVTRYFSANLRLCSRLASNRLIIPPLAHINGGSATQKIKDKKKNFIKVGEYRQLPEDNPIEKYYDEIETFSKACLEKQLKKNYSDFEGNPDELVFEIEKYVESQIIPKYSVLDEDREKTTPSLPSMVYCKTLGDKLVIERYISFARAVRLALIFNGGHPFIFDLMLQGRSVFDKIGEKTK